MAGWAKVESASLALKWSLQTTDKWTKPKRFHPKSGPTWSNYRRNRSEATFKAKLCAIKILNVLRKNWENCLNHQTEQHPTCSSQSHPSPSQPTGSFTLETQWWEDSDDCEALPKYWGQTGFSTSLFEICLHLLNGINLPRAPWNRPGCNSYFLTSEQSWRIRGIYSTNLVLRFCLLGQTGAK